MSKRCLIMAGGTGGHVFPALAVASALREQGWHVEWLGTAERMEARVVPAYDFPLHFLPVSGLRGKGLSARLRSLSGLARSVVLARRLMKSFKPDLVLGFGGYASGPGGLAARLAGIPLVIHEQNAAIGLTNKFLGRLAQRILLGFGQAASQFGRAQGRCVTVGNPVRPPIVALPAKTDVHDPLRVLIVGGSLGSQPLNARLPPLLGDHAGLSVWHQAGRDNAAQVEQAYAHSQASWQVSEFIEDMAEAYAWADVIICRAGALTVAEVAAAGLAAVFVPLPHAVDDHQTKNAQTLVAADAAWLVPQAQLERQLPAIVQGWLAQPHSLLEKGQHARQQAMTDATQHVVTQCSTLVGDTA